MASTVDAVAHIDDRKVLATLRARDQTTRLQPRRSINAPRVTDSFPVGSAAEIGVDFRRPAWVRHSSHEVPIDARRIDQTL